jgi:TPR repeat protein
VLQNRCRKIGAEQPPLGKVSVFSPFDLQYEKAMKELVELTKDGEGADHQKLQNIMKIVQKTADRGHAHAQYNLGIMYSEGTGGLPQSDALAVEWMHKAADQGLADAQYNLGVMHHDGSGGLPQSDALAVEWYHKAADQGHPTAQCNLGVMHHDGSGGLPQSDALAVEWYRKAADQGHPTAQYNLGVMHYDGSGGLPRSDTLAVEWYRKAADQGHPTAQYNLGIMYEHGKGGLPQSDALAVEWCRKAADQGLAEAQYNLGCAYNNGKGVPRSDTLAVEWFRKAAEQGSAAAQFHLGMSYYLGNGVQKNSDQAIKWLRLSESLGYDLAKKFISKFIKKEQGQEPSDQQPLPTATSIIAESSESPIANGSRVVLLGIQAKPEMNGRHGIVEAFNPSTGRFVVHLADGLGTMSIKPQNLHATSVVADFADDAEKQEASTSTEVSPSSSVDAKKMDERLNSAMRHLSKYMQKSPSDFSESEHRKLKKITKVIIEAANKGNPKATYTLGNMHQRGIRVPQSDSLAVGWFQKAADQGFPPAQCHLGIMYSEGTGGLPQSDALAVEWMHKAAYQGLADAQFNLGVMHHDGSGGLPQSDALAVEWCRKAADQGHPTAQFNLGIMYVNGEECQRDLTKALKWLRKAEAAGSSKAEGVIAMVLQQQQHADREESAKPLKSSESTMSIGSRVILRGLTSQPYLNGQRAVVQAELTNGRFRVLIDVSAKLVNVKLQNLRLQKDGGGDGSGDSYDRIEDGSTK